MQSLIRQSDATTINTPIRYILSRVGPSIPVGAMEACFKNQKKMMPSVHPGTCDVYVFNIIGHSIILFLLASLLCFNYSLKGRINPAFYIPFLVLKCKAMFAFAFSLRRSHMDAKKKSSIFIIFVRMFFCLYVRCYFLNKKTRGYEPNNT